MFISPTDRTSKPDRCSSRSTLAHTRLCSHKPRQTFSVTHHKFVLLKPISIKILQPLNKQRPFYKKTPLSKTMPTSKSNDTKNLSLTERFLRSNQIRCGQIPKRPELLCF